VSSKLNNKEEEGRSIDGFMKSLSISSFLFLAILIGLFLY